MSTFISPGVYILEYDIDVFPPIGTNMKSWNRKYARKYKILEVLKRIMSA